MTQASKQDSMRVDTRFSRRVAFALGCSVALLIGAVAFTANWIAGQHDQLARSNSFQIVGSALGALSERTESLAHDYSHWDPYYDAVLNNDYDWLYPNIVGGDFEEGADIELLVQLLPGHTTSQGWSVRHIGEVPTPDILDDALIAKMNAALNGTEINGRNVVSSFETIDGEIWIVAISRIIPWDGVAETVTDLEVPRQILGTRLNQDILNEINDQFFLRGMDLAIEAPKHADSIELKSVSDETVGYVSWAPPTPGARVLQQAPIPVMVVISFIIIVLVVGAINIRRNASKLEIALTNEKQANRQKDEFIATISHELRTPLTSITASIRMLSMGMLGNLPEKANEVLEVSERNAHILNSLIEDLLLMGAIDSKELRLKREPIDLNEVLKTAAENFRGYAAEHNVVVELALEDQPIHVDADARKLNQVIGNLLSNAAKFSPQGAVIRAELESGAEKVRISVRDNGIGIPDGSHADVFGRFRQVDSGENRKHNGSGVGLSIAKEIVDAHGGTLDYESELDVGTCFFIELDRISDPSEDNSATEQAERHRSVA